MDLARQAIVPLDAVDIITLSDRPAMNPTQFKKVETFAMLIRPRMVGTEPYVGGSTDHCRLKIDFSKGPLMPGQSEIRLRGDGSLKAPFPGKLVIRRLPHAVDVCIGQYSRPDGRRQLRIVYRFAVNDLSSIEFLVGDPPAEEMLQTEHGHVTAGQTILRLRRALDYSQGRFDSDNNPLFERPRGRVLMATKLDYFAAMNSMNTQQSDLVLPPPEEQAELTDAADWAFRVLLEVRSANVPSETGFVHVDPLDITGLGYPITPVLAGDLLRAVGPGGSLQLTSTRSGRVASIAYLNDQPFKRIILTDGSFQDVPICAPLRINGAAIDVDTELTAGQSIGDLCPRVNYHSLDMLREVSESNIRFLVQTFLQRTCVAPGSRHWRGPGVLYDWAYIPPEMLHDGLLPVDADGNPFAYFDFTRGRQYLDSRVGGLVFPPVLADPEGTVMIGRVSVDLAEPRMAPTKEPLAGVAG